MEMKVALIHSIRGHVLKKIHNINDILDPKKHEAGYAWILHNFAQKILHKEH